MKFLDTIISKVCTCSCYSRRQNSVIIATFSQSHVFRGRNSDLRVSVYRKMKMTGLLDEPRMDQGSKTLGHVQTEWIWRLIHNRYTRVISTWHRRGANENSLRYTRYSRNLHLPHEISIRFLQSGGYLVRISPYICREENRIFFLARDII